jgi:hypothetical protein
METPEALAKVASLAEDIKFSTDYQARRAGNTITIPIVDLGDGAAGEMFVDDIAHGVFYTPEPRRMERQEEFNERMKELKITVDEKPKPGNISRSNTH